MATALWRRSVPALGASGAVRLDTLCGNKNHLLESPGKSQHLGTEWHAVTGCSGNSSISHLAAASCNITRAAFSEAARPRRRQGFLAAWKKKRRRGIFVFFVFLPWIIHNQSRRQGCRAIALNPRRGSGRKSKQTRMRGFIHKLPKESCFEGFFWGRQGVFGFCLFFSKAAGWEWGDLECMWIETEQKRSRFSQRAKAPLRNDEPQNGNQHGRVIYFCFCARAGSHVCAGWTEGQEGQSHRVYCGACTHAHAHTFLWARPVFFFL